MKVEFKVETQVLEILAKYVDVDDIVISKMARPQKVGDARFGENNLGQRIVRIFFENGSTKEYYPNEELQVVRTRVERIK